MLSIGDAQSIFIGCLLEVDGEIAYVLDIDNSGIQNLLHIATGETFFRKGSFDDIKPVQNRLGYVNYAGQSVYIYRTTKRQYKFGLHRNNIRIGDGFQRNHLYEVVANELMDLKSKAYLDTFNGNYPNLIDSLKMIQKGATVVAFDRQFCIGSNGRIGYKDEPVGRIHNGSIIWSAGKEYLEQVVTKGQI